MEAINYVIGLPGGKCHYVTADKFLIKENGSAVFYLGDKLQYYIAAPVYIALQ